MAALWRVVVEGVPGADTALPEKGMLVIGSSSERADFHVPGQGVEDAHCAIGRAKDGSWAVKDLGSQYGTYLNGEKVAAARLKPGDVLVVGSQSLKVVDPDSATAAPDPAPVATPSSGEPSLERLAGFRIEGRLGRGGMGEVLLAVQESLNRPVALKVLSPKLSRDTDFVRRFQSEARAAAALSHPNVVVVHDVGEADGRHYLAMEYMPGGSLEERVARDGAVSWREVLAILHDAAAGLKYAEAQGILHRDIKPANLMVAASGAIKIADLGLATTVEEQAGESKVYGTPHFVSPEQARGQTVDHRSDLYSLGATAYRLLTGRTPFEGATAKEIVRARFTETPVPPRRLVPELPDALQELVLSLMARDPNDRPASAEALLATVDRLRLELTHGTQAGGTTEEPATRSRLPLVAGIGALLVLGGGAAAFVVFGGGNSEVEGGGDGTRVTDGGDAADPANVFGGEGSAAITSDEEFFGSGDEDGPTEIDEEESLRVQELEAELAYSRIPAELDRTDRIAELDSLAERYASTSFATRARGEAATLRAELENRQLASESAERALILELSRLRSNAGWDPEGLEPDAIPDGWTLAAGVLAATPSATLTDTDGFEAGRSALVTEILTTTRDRARATLESGRALAERGAFDELEVALQRIVDRLVLPEPAEDEHALLEELRAVRREAAEELAGLAAARTAYAERLEAGDRRTLAGLFGPSSALFSELEALDFRFLARLDASASQLATEAARERLARWRTRLGSAASALSALDDFASWRRKSVALPGVRGGRDALGVRAGGVLVDAGAGPELVPWGTFATEPDSLHGLFNGRLERDYTAAEQGAIQELLTLNAVVHALAPARALLARQARFFQPSDAEAMRASFAQALAWSEDEPNVPAEARRHLRREREALELLIRGLQALEDEAWGRVVSSLEYLGRAYADTLVTALLSDGSVAPRPGPPEPEPLPGSDDGDAASETTKSVDSSGRGG